MKTGSAVADSLDPNEMLYYVAFHLVCQSTRLGPVYSVFIDHETNEFWVYIIFSITVIENLYYFFANR